MHHCEKMVIKLHGKKFSLHKWSILLKDNMEYIGHKKVPLSGKGRAIFEQILIINFSC